VIPIGLAVGGAVGGMLGQTIGWPGWLGVTGVLRSDSTVDISGVSTPRADVPPSTTPSQRLEAAKVGAVPEVEVGDLEVEVGDLEVEVADLEVKVEAAARTARSPDRH
jgi:hypothetical protein